MLLDDPLSRVAARLRQVQVNRVLDAARISRKRIIRAARVPGGDRRDPRYLAQLHLSRRRGLPREAQAAFVLLFWQRLARFQSAIAFRSKTSADNASQTSFGVTLPTGTLATDILVVSLAWSDNASTVNVPSGWTSIATGVGDANLQNSAYWALGNVASLAFSLTLARVNGYVCAAFSGVNNITPVDATGTTSTITGSATITANAVTAVTANDLWVICNADFNDGVFSATGFTVQNNGATPAQQSASMMYKAITATGSTGTVTCTDSASATGQHLAAIPFALRPDTTSAETFPAGYYPRPWQNTLLRM